MSAVREPGTCDPRREAAVERAEALKRAVHELIPEAGPNFIKPLFAAGLIDGWRNVVECCPVMGRMPKNNERKG